VAPFFGPPCILYSHPVLVVHLSVLFNILLAYGVVPDAFGHGVIIPLIKNADEK